MCGRGLGHMSHVPHHMVTHVDMSNEMCRYVQVKVWCLPDYISSSPISPQATQSCLTFHSDLTKIITTQSLSYERNQYVASTSNMYQRSHRDVDCNSISLSLL